MAEVTPSLPSVQDAIPESASSYRLRTRVYARKRPKRFGRGAGGSSSLAVGWDASVSGSDHWGPPS